MIGLAVAISLYLGGIVLMDVAVDLANELAKSTHDYPRIELRAKWVSAFAWPMVAVALVGYALGRWLDRLGR